MNIFYTNENPKLCALDHCDVHVRKMIVEYCQLLSTAHRMIDGHEIIGQSKTGRKQRQWTLPDEREDILYKATHINHPSAKWVRVSSQHYEWLVQVVGELLEIYFHHSQKTHKADATKLFLMLKNVPEHLPDNGWEEPYIAINKDHYSGLVHDFNAGNLTTMECYRIYMKKKFREWVTRKDRRQIIARWPIQKPSWFDTSYLDKGIN